MHPENLGPLLIFVPVLAVILLAAIALYAVENIRRRRNLRNQTETTRRYWITELAWRAKFRTKEWFTRTKRLRLTYQVPAPDREQSE